MKKFFKKFALLTVIATMSLTSLLSGCATNPPADSNKSVPEFSVDLAFKTWADRPPTPTVDHLQMWKDAGLTHFNLTDDDYTLTDADKVRGNDDDAIINPKIYEVLDACEELGLEVLIRNFRTDPDWFWNDDPNAKYAEPPWNYEYFIPVRHITTELTEQEAVSGYYMGDEPSYQKIGTFENLVNWYNSYGGKTLWHMNLLQSYAPSYMMTDAEGNHHSYAEYVRWYCDEVLEKVDGPKTLGTDYYPLVLSNGQPIIKNGILGDYITIAENVNRMNAESTDSTDVVTTNLCIQVYDSSTTRKLSSMADIVFQTNLAAAFGAKSLQYYLYRATSGDGGMITMTTQEKTDMYYWVKDTNEQMQILADAILNFDWVGTKAYAGQQISDENNVKGFELVASQLAEKFAFISNVTCRVDTVISEMADASGNKGYMVVNFSEPSKGLADYVDVTFGPKVTKAVVYTTGTDGVKKEVIDVENNAMRLVLTAGGGAFVYPVSE